MRARHSDLIDWCRQNASSIKAVRTARSAAEKGFVAYWNDIGDFMREYRENKANRSAGIAPVENKKAEAEESRVLYQQEASKDLLRKMKWKRVSWEEGVDFENFARRVMDNDTMFKRVPAFSFLSVKLVRDPSNFTTLKAKNLGLFSPGDLTSWCCVEREPVVLAPFTPPSATRPPFTIDWSTAEAKMLDSISPHEVLTFLTTTASQIQAAQVRMEDEYTKLAADIEFAKVRTGALRFRYNEFDVTFWDDPRRPSNPNYVTPEHLRTFIDGVLNGALVYRWYLAGHEIRVVHPNQPYKVDAEAKVLNIPANFADFNWVPLHHKAAAIESFLNANRTIWWVWMCFLAMLIGGDLDII